MSEVDPGRFIESTLDDIRSSVDDVESYNVDVWDIDESKLSGYNVGIFDDTAMLHDVRNDVAMDSDRAGISSISKSMLSLVEHMLYEGQVHLNGNMIKTMKG